MRDVSSRYISLNYHHTHKRAFVQSASKLFALYRLIAFVVTKSHCIAYMIQQAQINLLKLQIVRILIRTCNELLFPRRVQVNRCVSASAVILAHITRRMVWQTLNLKLSIHSRCVLCDDGSWSLWASTCGPDIRLTAHDASLPVSQPEKKNS